MQSTAETVIALFDFVWFQQSIFTTTKKNPISISSSPPKTETTLPLLDITQVHHVKEEEEKPKLNRNTSLLKKSLSDEFLSSKDISSPRSVLMPQLQTILSGKQVENFPDSKNNKKPLRVKQRRRRSRSSKSLSELEIEELKGFMDLGFVFSDEDNKDSKLVSIIPALQRFRENANFDEKLSRRPYLSEVWDCLEDEEIRKNKFKMDFRIEDFGNEMVLKDQIKFWAHSVASAVK